MSSTVYILCIVVVALIALLIVTYHEEKLAKQAEADVKETQDRLRAQRFEALRRAHLTEEEIVKTRRVPTKQEELLRSRRGFYLIKDDQ